MIKVGKSVVLHGVTSNNHEDQPGVITHVWSIEDWHPAVSAPAHVRGTANVKLFPDCGEIRDVTSVWVFETRAGFTQYRASGNNETAGYLVSQ